jgi:thiosulfate/3-mercaptopyruvate sulfurtransferase
MAITDKGYAHPDALVSTDWVAEHLQDPNVRLVESNEDPLVYPSGHIPGAVQIDWTADLNDPLRRDYIAAKDFAALVSRFGITPDTTVVLYGDRNNWWACYAFWVFQLFGHTNAVILDGGRLKWEKEGRPLTRDVPTHAASTYPVPAARQDAAHRAFREQVLTHSEAGGQLVDVRSPDEYTGAKLHMPEYPQEGAMRGGHIPGAKSVPWARAINPEDGTFKDAEQLKAIYLGEKHLDPAKETIAYCRIGERSSHTWFTLKYLLGFDNIRNYDGSWTEWGNLVGVPVAKGPEADA